jgi:parvulin-like peptidyl-prolyl isomerase
MTASRLRRCAPALVVLVVAAGVAGCSSTLSDAATVHYPKGEGAETMHVDLADFEKELGELTASAKFRELLKQNQLTGNQSDISAIASAVWLGDLVTQAAVDREFEARNLKLTDADIQTAMREIAAPSQTDPPLLVPSRITPDVFKSFSKSYQRKIAERRARADAVLQSYANPTPAEVQSFYDNYKDELSCRRVAHILVKTEAEAKTVLSDLKAGKSFADLAKAKSTDTGSAQNGGDVGCLTPGAFVAEFQTAAEDGPLDTPIGPVKTEFGYHVLQVHKTVPSFEQIRSQVAEALKQGAAVKEAIATASVEINPRFGSPGGVRGDQNTGVLAYQIEPPAVPDVANNRDPSATTTSVVPLGQ